MKRLVRKAYNDKEIADFIFEKAKEIYEYDYEIVPYTKKMMDQNNVTVDEMIKNEYYANQVLVSTLKQSMELYDSVSDRFFSDDPNTYQEITDQYSGNGAKITNYIENLSKYTDKKWQDLLQDENIVNELR